MQVVYALPFVFLSLLAFILCLIIQRWRPYAIRAVVAPVAFGVSSLIALVIGTIAGDFVASLMRASEAVRNNSAYLGLFFYPAGGACGAWLAVALVGASERRLPPSAKQRLLRAVIAIVVLGLVSLISLVVAANLAPRWYDTGPLLFVGGAGLVGLVAASLSYRFVGRIWRETFSVE